MTEKAENFNSFTTQGLVLQYRRAPHVRTSVQPVSLRTERIVFTGDIKRLVSNFSPDSLDKRLYSQTVDMPAMGGPKLQNILLGVRRDALIAPPTPELVRCPDDNQELVKARFRIYKFQAQLSFQASEGVWMHDDYVQKNPIQMTPMCFVEGADGTQWLNLLGRSAEFARETRNPAHHSSDIERFHLFAINKNPQCRRKS